MGHFFREKQAGNMKLLVISCVLAVASCAPQNRVEEPIAILRQESFMNGGNFNYNFEAENGINVASDGSPNVEGASVMQGLTPSPFLMAPSPPSTGLLMPMVSVWSLLFCLLPQRQISYSCTFPGADQVR